jgi:hypothetical protein
MVKVYEPIRQQAEATARTLAVTERSSVYFGVPKLAGLPQPDGTISEEIQVEIGNSGGSTTRGLTYRVACKPSDKLIDDPFDRGFLNSAAANRNPLPPKRPPVTPEACALAPIELAFANIAKLSVYVFGEADYRDTIDPDTTHHVEFCARLHNFAFGSGGIAALTEYCKRHNCTDDECNE